MSYLPLAIQHIQGSLHSLEDENMIFYFTGCQIDRERSVLSLYIADIKTVHISLGRFDENTIEKVFLNFTSCPTLLKVQ